MSPTTRATIALSLMAGFYLLAIGSGVGLIALAVAMVSFQNLGAIKLAFFAAVAGGTVLWSLRPRRDRFEPPGPRLSKEAQPELFAVIEDVARAANQEMPVEVYAIPDVNAWVSTRGGLLGVGGKRVMGLGIPLLHLLTVDQLKAVLAHEFGHYGGGDTKIGRLVYHTRLGLGRTLAAVEGKSIEVLFNAYGRVVMRVSTAVARHQEFAADAFAARATSGQDLADSLQKIDRQAPLFPLFLASNMQPIIEEGYWAPIGSGFSTFCADPSVNSIRMQAPPDPGGGDAGAPDTTYDSHPSTEARVAALAALTPGPARIIDGRLAGTLLRASTQIESELYRLPQSRVARLKLVAWEHVTSQVLVPRWQRIARERSDILKQVRIESLPASRKEVVQLGRTTGGQKMRMMDHSEVMQEVIFAICCGVATQLIDRGWMPIESPNLFCEFVRGEERIDPMREISEIGLGVWPVAEWKAFCEKEGLSGPLAATGAQT